MGESRKISDIKDLKYFKPLLKLLRDLHLDGCRRDRAGNRKLHYDQYSLLILQSYFNPMAQSVRAIVKPSKLEKVQKKLGCSAASLGSFSEAAGVFDPELIKRVAHTLSRQVKPVQDVGKGHLRNKLVAVDGTVLRTFSMAKSVDSIDRVDSHAKIALIQKSPGDSSPEEQYRCRAGVTRS